MPRRHWKVSGAVLLAVTVNEVELFGQSVRLAGWPVMVGALLTVSEALLLVIEPHEGANVTADKVLEYLGPRIVKWWTPDKVLFDTVPLTATGKIDKKVLRDKYKDALMA